MGAKGSREVLDNSNYLWYTQGVAGGEMNQPLPYNRFLQAMIDEVAEAIRVSEYHGWHHLRVDTPEFICYNRLMTWADSLRDRKVWYDDIKGR